mmetsp:Transcript_31150/g.78706  ORF Transcript_31150/g.78706 Transcript_31150/m.78706 type:complete len:331 (+) Transcript_31150:199-1191(+)
MSSTTERDIFTELFWKIRNLKYVPSEDEMDTLKSCEAEAYRRAGLGAFGLGGASFAAFTALGMTRTRKLAAYSMMMINALGGGYYGAKSASTFCLESLVGLESPIGGELAVILARRCPDSALVNLSPWAEAIKSSRDEYGAYQGAQWTPDSDVDTRASLEVEQRVATPEAIAALRAMRREGGLALQGPSAPVPPSRTPRGDAPQNSGKAEAAAEGDGEQFMPMLWEEEAGDGVAVREEERGEHGAPRGRRWASARPVQDSNDGWAAEGGESGGPARRRRRAAVLEEPTEGVEPSMSGRRRRRSQAAGGLDEMDDPWEASPTAAAADGRAW